MKIRKIDRYYYLIFISCMLDLNCFYLIDADRFNIFGVTYLDLVLFFHVAIIGITVLEKLKTRRFIIAIGSLLMIIPIFLAFTSAYAGTRTYGQSFLQGLVSQRQWLGCILMFFPIAQWLDDGRISKDGLIKVINYVSCILLAICIFQYIIGNTFVFTHSMANERYGESRYYFSTVYPILSAAFVFDTLSNREINISSKTFWKSALMLGASVFLCAVVTKGRANTTAFVGAILVCLIIGKTNSWKKILFLSGTVIGGVFFISSNIGQDVLTVLTGGKIETNTLSVRTAGREYYMAKVFSHMYSVIFGCGSPNIHSEMAQRISNPLWKTAGTARFYLADNGIFSEIYIFGLLGFIWFLIIYILSIKKALKIYKNSGKCSYLLFLLTDLMGCITLTPALFDVVIAMPLFLSLLNYEDKLYKLEEGEV